MAASHGALETLGVLAVQHSGRVLVTEKQCCRNSLLLGPVAGEDDCPQLPLVHGREAASLSCAVNLLPSGPHHLFPTGTTE